MALTPYICVSNTDAALAWYAKAFGAETTVEPIVMDDGKVGHAEMEVFGARVMMSDEYPDLQVVLPSKQGASVTLHVDVPDVDAAIEQAHAAGASVDREPDETQYGRIGVVRDPYGHRWMLNGPQAEAAS